MTESAPAVPAPRIIRIRLWSEMAVAFLLLSELTWISAFYSALSDNRVPWLKTLVVLGLVVLISHYLARALNRSRLDDRRRRIIFIAWLSAALFGSLRLLVLGGQRASLYDVLIRPFFGITQNETESFAEFWHLALVAILIWRGVARAREPVYVITALRSFQLGLLVFIGYGLIFAPLQPESRSILYLAAYLFLGLLSMTMARIAVVSELRGGKIGKFSRKWLAGVAAAAVMLIAAALGVGILVRTPLTVILGEISFVFFIILSVITLILTYPLVWLFNLLSPLIRNVIQNFPGLGFLTDIQNWVRNLAQSQQNLLEEAAAPVAASRGVVRVVILAVVLLVILLALRWKPFSRRAAGEEEVSDVRGRFRLPGLPDLDPRRLIYRITHAGRLLAAARIRQIYTELTDLCAALGTPRPASATPEEYLPALLALFPALPGELNLLTGAYEKIRYGELPESPREVQEAETAWSQIRAEGRQMLAERRRKKRSD